MELLSAESKLPYLKVYRLLGLCESGTNAGRLMIVGNAFDL